MSAVDQGQVIAQLKAEITDLKSSCQKLTSSNKAFRTAQKLSEKLERDAQLARRQYDQVLADRRKQAAELEQLLTKFEELRAGDSSDGTAQQQSRQLQTQIDNTASQVTEALATQQAYQDVIQQLREGHEQFGGALEELKQHLQNQQRVVCQSKAQLLRLQHSRDLAKRDLHTAELQLAAGRAGRTAQLQQLAQQCRSLLQEQLQAQSLDQANWSHQARESGEYETSDAVQVAEPSKSPATSSAAQCIEDLLVATGCRDASQLQMHVQALLRASASLQK